ncbi:MAG TPA: cobalamin-binding protein, partial [Alteromonas macleodii]|nr:cobalamin-binding protein [Alteromonas macleodii]
MKTIFFVILSYLPLLTFANSESDAETKHLAHSDQFASADVAPSSESSALSNSVELKIVSLAPHLTEWAFSLGLGPNLVGVSDYSDYPDAAKNIKRVADFQGADIATIVA